MPALWKVTKGIWHDPVWSKVIATSIVALVAYFFPWWRSVIQYAKMFWTFLFQSSDVANWLLILMALCTTLVAGVLIVVLWQIIKPQNPAPSWKENYLQDNFFNILWRWSYDYNGRPERIFSFCPECDLQIHAQNSSFYIAVPRILFHCDSCNKSIYEFQGHYDEMESKVIRFLQQKIRNGSWNKIQVESSLTCQ